MWKIKWKIEKEIKPSQKNEIEDWSNKTEQWSFVAKFVTEKKQYLRAEVEEEECKGWREWTMVFIYLCRVFKINRLFYLFIVKIIFFDEQYKLFFL